MLSSALKLCSDYPYTEAGHLKSWRVLQVFSLCFSVHEFPYPKYDYSISMDHPRRLSTEPTRCAPKHHPDIQATIRWAKSSMSWTGNHINLVVVAH
jgi:hypothetical protein